MIYLFQRLDIKIKTIAPLIINHFRWSMESNPYMYSK